MAHAQHIDTNKPKKLVGTIRLDLSPEEAHFLYLVIGRTIIGDSLNSARKYTDSIHEALEPLNFVRDVEIFADMTVNRCCEGSHKLLGYVR